MPTFYFLPSTFYLLLSLTFFPRPLLFAHCPDRRFWHSFPQALRDHFDDLIPVKPAILDEDIRRVAATDGAACQEQAGHVGLERRRVEFGRHRVLLEPDAHATVQIAVGVISRQQKDGVGG